MFVMYGDVIFVMHGDVIFVMYSDVMFVMYGDVMFVMYGDGHACASLSAFGLWNINNERKNIDWSYTERIL